MNIEGSYTMQASPERVWQNLMDPQVLLCTVPGIEKLEQLDAATYEITIQMKHAPLKGIYRGHITTSEQQFPHRYRIEVHGEGHQNIFSGHGSIELKAHNTHTVIAYHGELKQDKHSALLPPSVVKGAAKLLIQQFFAALSIRLGTPLARDTVDSEMALNGMTMQRPAGTITLLSPDLPPQRPTLLRTLLRLSGLGDDRQAIVYWETRLRRWGLIAGLLFLVWVGTRIPRKH